MKTSRESGRNLAAAALAALLSSCAPAVAHIAVGSGPQPRAQATDPAAPARLPSLAVAELRCEHAEEPLALDTTAPRFSWKLAALAPERRGLRQSAYRIRVASSPAELAAEHGDLWDSDRVASNETVDVVYAGRALRSFELAHWQVRVWDQDGVESEWSAAARFGMGALAPEDWHARWIGFDAPLRSMRPVPDLGEARWIHAGGAGKELWLRRRFALAGPVDPQAVLVVAAVDEFEVLLNGQSVLKGSATSGVRRNAELVKVARMLRTGENLLAVRARAAGDTPVAFACRLVLVPDAPAEEHEVRSDASWLASGDPAEGWEQPSFDDSRWSPALPIDADEPWLPQVDPPAALLPPPRLLRTEFRARAQPVRATLYASALGVYALELNGERTNSDWFAPGWTDYERRIPYRAYDVTERVHAGANALGVVLADGWYAGFLGKRGQRNHYGTSPRFLGQLVLDYADGTRDVVVSDGSWRGASGPWREADLYMGERYDARLELAGWSTSGLDAQAWQPVEVDASERAPLRPHPGPEVRVIAELEPVSVTERGGGRALFDFGQNIAGVVRLALEAPAGTSVVLKFAEALEADGSLMRRNLGWARAVDQYVCKGGGRESWQPRFTYHGFRYVEVSGLPAQATKELLTALALSSATTLAGDFRCSDPLVNAEVASARWTLRANAMDFPTDCPQRGERLGWTGDAQLAARSALWLADLQGFYDKWSLDLLDAQRANGRFPATAPSFPGMTDGGPAWEDAGVLVPALVREFYGDHRLTERHFESMQRFVAACAERAGPECRAPETIEGYGDWNHLDAETPKDVLWLAYFARSTRRLAAVARSLGRTSEAQRLTEELARIRSSFGAHCVDAAGRVRGETQTGLALALNENLLPGALRERAAAHLVDDLARRGGLTTGFVGTAELLPALSAIGRTDLAYDLLRRRSFPSWGYMLDHGATTLWERWDAWTVEHGFANNGRASLDHTPFAGFVAWLFDTAAGIRPSEPGFRSVELAPAIGGGLAWAEASYASCRGEIRLRWERAGDALRLDVRVPPNVTATLSVPPTSGPLLEGGRALGEVAGVRELGRLGEALLLALEPGSYRFEGRAAPGR